MRITHVIASPAHGGGTNQVVAMVTELAALGYSNAVVTSGPGPLVEAMSALGVPVAHVDMMRSRLDPRVPIALRRLPEIAAADVIHAYGTRAGFFAQTARLSPVVYTVLGLSYRQVQPFRSAVGLGAEWVACRAEEITTVAAADRDSLRRRHVSGGRSVRHIANGVDAERFAPGDRIAARRRLGLAEDALIVGSAVRLVPQKAVDVLIRAFRHVPSAQLVIVGDGELRSSLESLARPLGDAVCFLGMRDDLPAILPAFDVFALSSRWEGEPIALLEAMACGLPCVATDTGARELLRGGLGVLVPIDDEEALARALAGLLDDPGRRESYARAARAFAVTRSWRTTAQRLAKVYEEMTGMSHEQAQAAAR